MARQIRPSWPMVTRLFTLFTLVFAACFGCVQADAGVDVVFPKPWVAWTLPARLGGVSIASVEGRHAADACLKGASETAMHCATVPGRVWVRFVGVLDRPLWACVPVRWIHGDPTALRTPIFDPFPARPQRLLEAPSALTYLKVLKETPLWSHPTGGWQAGSLKPDNKAAILSENDDSWQVDAFQSLGYVRKDEAGVRVGHSIWAWLRRLSGDDVSLRTCWPFSLGPTPPPYTVCLAGGDGYYRDAFNRGSDALDGAWHWLPEGVVAGESCLP